MKKTKKLKDRAGLEQYGLWLLSQRDMSRNGVKQKFMDYAEDKGDIEGVLDKLEEYDYLNDERYAANYARSCKESRGYGPMKIKFKLKEKGLSDKLIARNVDDRDPEWYELAYKARERRFGEPPENFEDKNKQMQFLVRRGFSFDHAKSAFNKPEEHA